MKLVKRLGLFIFGFGVMLILVEIAHNIWFIDYSSLLEIEVCSEQIRKVALNHELACPSCGESYSIFPKPKLAKDGTRYVAAADASLCHSMDTSFFASKKRFAVVLFNNGQIAQWIGNQSEYSRATQAAMLGATEESSFFLKSEKSAKQER